MDDKRREYLRSYQELRKRISVSLSEADYKKIQYLASREQLKPTSYISQVVQEKLGKNPHLPRELKQELSALKFLIRNIANNINQITHRSHTLQVMVDERDLLMELKKLEDSVSAYVSKEATR